MFFVSVLHDFEIKRKEVGGDTLPIVRIVYTVSMKIERHDNESALDPPIERGTWYDHE